MIEEPTYRLIVVSIERQIFSDMVYKIQVMGTEGEMGIFPGHSPLLASIKPSILSVSKACDYAEYMYISGGIEVQNNIVTILADTVIRAEELDEKKAKEAQCKATEYTAQHKHHNDADLTYIKNAADISKAIAKLRLIALTKKNKYI